MATKKASKSEQVRSRLDHPVIDADGHIVEMTPVLVDYVRQVGGSAMADRYGRPQSAGEGDAGSYRAAGILGGMQERRDNWVPMGGWGTPKSTLDRATAAAPRLLAQRLDELGTDFAVLYPSQGLAAAAIDDAELRRVACRAYNTFAMDITKEFADRMTPVATIPMHTPAEAVDELDHAVKTLGFKAVSLQASIPRSIPGRAASRLELFALDSDYDYDEVWAKCMELKVAPAFHSIVQGMGADSVSNYVYNHIGLLAVAHLTVCKALFMGGVTRRFPDLNFAFLEGGVAWASALYSDLFSHWEKRNGTAIRDLDPANLDGDLMMRLLREHGHERMVARADEIRAHLERKPSREPPDDFAACGIDEPEQIRDLFIPSFYFGCEGDDPTNAMAYNRSANPYGEALRTIFGSDIGHWDVVTMNEVLAEAFEMVERGSMTEADFRDYVFTNPVRLHAGVNPTFFEGTRVEDEVARLLAAGV